MGWKSLTFSAFQMLELGRPCSIVNMSSVASSIKGLKNRFAYGASKAAVIGLSRYRRKNYQT